MKVGKNPGQTMTVGRGTPCDYAREGRRGVIEVGRSHIVRPDIREGRLTERSLRYKGTPRPAVISAQINLAGDLKVTQHNRKRKYFTGGKPSQDTVCQQSPVKPMWKLRLKRGARPPSGELASFRTFC